MNPTRTDRMDLVDHFSVPKAYINPDKIGKGSVTGPGAPPVPPLHVALFRFLVDRLGDPEIPMTRRVPGAPWDFSHLEGPEAVNVLVRKLSEEEIIFVRSIQPHPYAARTWIVERGPNYTKLRTFLEKES